MSNDRNLPPIVNLTVEWEERGAARAKAIQALADLMPVFAVNAQFVPEEGYAYKGNGGKEDIRNARCWVPMRNTPEYSAVMESLADYLRFTVAKNHNTTGFIVANDSSVDVNDLYSLCVMYVLGKLPVFLRNVSTRYESRKGMVGKAEGCLLYIDHAVANILIDYARRLCSRYGRNAEPADLFDSAGRSIRSPEELNPFAAVVRKGSRVGLFLGDEYINGIRYGFFRFLDECEEYIPWGIIADRIRVFTGDMADAAAAIPCQEKKKLTANTPISLNQEIGDKDDEESICLMNLLPGFMDCEETVINEEDYAIVRETYQLSMRSLRGDPLRQLMLSFLVKDALCQQLSHADEILSTIRKQGIHQVIHDNHELNCAIFDMEASELQTMTAAQGCYTAKELTAAKHQVKKLFRRNLSLAMAA